MNVDKRLEKMQINPKDWRIEDLQAIADLYQTIYSACRKSKGATGR